MSYIFLRKSSHSVNFSIFFLIALALFGCGGGGGINNTVTPAQTSNSGVQLYAGGYGGSPSISDDGRYVAYVAQGVIYRLDVLTGINLPISINTSGTYSSGYYAAPIISGDGQYILFESKETNLVNGLSNYPTDSSNQVITQLYVRDILNGRTTLVTIDPSGTTPANDWTDYDKYRISKNGGFVVFSSKATNLVNGVTYQGGDNVFVRNLSSGNTELVSISVDGTSSGKNGTTTVFTLRNDSFFPSISENGRYVIFESMAWNLVNGISYTPDSSFVVSNVFSRDLVTGITTLISISSDGTQASNGNCSLQTFNGGRNISENASQIVFSSRATNLTNTILANTGGTNVYLRDISSQYLILISIGANGLAANGSSYAPALSTDGQYVAFSSDATNLVNSIGLYWTLGISPGGPVAKSIFRWTKTSRKLEMVSVSVDGTSGADFDTQFPTISNDGQVVTYSGLATNLTISPAVPLTFDSRQDSIYRWNAATNKNVLVTQANGFSLGNASPEFAMSSNGKLMAVYPRTYGSSLATY